MILVLPIHWFPKLKEPLQLWNCSHWTQMSRVALSHMELHASLSLSIVPTSFLWHKTKEKNTNKQWSFAYHYSNLHIITLIFASTLGPAWINKIRKSSDIERENSEKWWNWLTIWFFVFGSCSFRFKKKKVFLLFCIFRSKRKVFILSFKSTQFGSFQRNWLFFQARKSAWCYYFAFSFFFLI